MDTRRSQSMRKVATPQASKTKMPPKTQSQASVTPSQMSEQTRLANADKNPLDALSRSTARQAVERRSGLQDVDDDYMKRLTFPNPAAPRYEFAAGQRTPNPMAQTDSSMDRMQGGADPGFVRAQLHQGQPVPNQQMTTAIPQQVQSQAQPNSAQPMQQNTAPNPMAQPQQSSPMAQSNAAQQQQPQQQQPPTPQQQVTYYPAAGEPEMCTTCPNCQTTIYLARGNVDLPPPQGMVAVHGQPDGTTMTAVKQ